MADIRDISYLNKDFGSFKNDLISYSKTYFPNTYNDFGPSSTGMLFIEMASYVGDVLSFYLDNQIQETFIQYARQKENLYNMSYMLGYKPKVTSAASTYIDFYQKVPAMFSGIDYVPDYSYAMQINPNTKIRSNNNSSINFITQDKVDFSFSSSYDPTEVSVYEIAGTTPTYFLLKKTAKAISSDIKTVNFTFGAPTRFNTVDINLGKIVGIIDAIDSEGNNWYEVDNLSQDVIYDTIDNSLTINKTENSDYNTTPELLKLKSVQRRYVSRFINDSVCRIQFGSGISNNLDEEIIPNPNNVGLGLPFERSKLTTAYSPLNFIFTDSYGISPSNTTITFRVMVGGGLESNVPQNTLTKLDTSGVKFLNSTLGDSVVAQDIFNSVACTNPKSASGGKDGDNIDELRFNSLGTFQNQLRTVTESDYIIRSLSMPSNLGSIAKVFPVSNKLTSKSDQSISPIDLYILGFDNNKNLITSSDSLKENLKTYLSQYRIINDSIRLKDGFIVNIGVNFDIITLPRFNNNEVILRCINALTDYFNIDKWQINQPIILKDIYVLLDKIEGVQTVNTVDIINKSGSVLGYSDFSYDIAGATVNNVVYPSLDPMIFELKYPQSDIQGRCVNLF